MFWGLSTCKRIYKCIYKTKVAIVLTVSVVVVVVAVSDVAVVCYFVYG